MPASLADHMIALPLLVLAAGTVVTLLAAAFAGNGAASLRAAGATLFCALLSLGPLASHMPAPYTSLFFLDGVSFLSIGLVLFSALCVVLIARPYLDRQELPPGEFAVLILLATLGGLVLVASRHFASLFLGIELIGIPLAALAAYHRGRGQSIEAGFKYLVLAGISSAIMLFGIALLYALTGDLSFGTMMTRPAPLYHIGLALIIAGMGFKLALVPFHLWAPDVYEGAPAPVTVFTATAVKAAAFTALLRLAPPARIDQDRHLFLMLAAVSVASMTLGNISALRQRSVKRMLAYSSIAHNGYLLVAFLSPGTLASPAILLFLVSYVVTNLAAFGIVSLLSRGDSDADDLDDYAGLSWRRPGMAALMTIAVLSLLGLPLTAGFIAKFSVMTAGMESARLALVLALVVNTAISAYYYLRIVMTMFLGRHEVPSAALRHADRRISSVGVLVVVLQAALLLAIGIAPQYLIRLIQRLLV
jgi:NADH-quinone oxidoreductase subunit N